MRTFINEHYLHSAAKKYRASEHLNRQTDGLMDSAIQGLFAEKITLRLDLMNFDESSVTDRRTSPLFGTPGRIQKRITQ